MKILHVTIMLWISFFIQGCVGTAVLKRGKPDTKGFRETPGLCEVPDRPEATSFEERGNLKDKLENDYEKELPEIKSSTTD